MPISHSDETGEWYSHDANGIVDEEDIDPVEFVASLEADMREMKQVVSDALSELDEARKMVGATLLDILKKARAAAPAEGDDPREA